MLWQKNRLTYREFYNNPSYRKYFKSACFDLTVKPSKISEPRVVITVPKKLDKRSVYRNRTKRIIGESLRNYLKNIHPGIDILIKSKKILKKTDRKMVEKELLSLLGKAIR